MQCPVCGNTTDVKTLKQQFIGGKTSRRLLAVIWESEHGKVYKLPRQIDFDMTAKYIKLTDKPTEIMPVQYTQALPSCTWGITYWSDLFSDRQLHVMLSLIKKNYLIRKEFIQFDEEYAKSIQTYLSIFVNRIATRVTSFGLWNTAAETLEHPFGRQAIPMILDYPESNPFTSSTGGGLNQLEWITRYIETESSDFYGICINASSGDKQQFDPKSITAVITDPPYYDAIAYADLSDFFYVWMKRTLSDVFPLNFTTPQTPKTEECTALKHHHNGNKEIAKQHFENKLTEIFDAIEHQTTDIVSIMFAHQSTEAWTTLCNSILGSRMNITGSWAIDTERSSAGVKTDKAFLSSSVTVACTPTQRFGFGEYKEIRRAIDKTVAKEVADLYQLGFRGADLLTACFGQAVSEFGKYEKVEKADGSEVTVAELLEMARESAFNALLKGFEGDDFTKFYIGWLQLYSLAESDFDDAAKFSRVGLSINVSELFTEHILIKNGNKQTLGTFEQRIQANKHLGDRATSFLIDQVHRAMALYKGSNRSTLLNYIARVAAQPESSFWRVVTSLCEVLPAGSEDHKQAFGLLTNKDSLIRESKAVLSPEKRQLNMEF